MPLLLRRERPTPTGRGRGVLAVCAIAALLVVIFVRLPAKPPAGTGAPSSDTGLTNAVSAASGSEAANVGPSPVASAPNAIPEAGGEMVQQTNVPEAAFHHDLPDTPILFVPCHGDHGPADPTDAQCVARWVIFHLATDQLGEVSRWVDSAILSQQRTSVAREVDPTEVLVLDAQDELDQIGPARAQVHVVVERSWATGQIEHLYFNTVLALDGDGNGWRLISLERQ